MIIFSSISIEGFGSIIEKLFLPLNSRGVNVLIAKNGAGKTTIFSALYWVIYGKPIKKKASVKTWEKYRPSDYRGTRVILNFKKDNTLFKLIGHEDFKGDTLGSKGGSRLILIQDGQERKDLRDKADVRKEVIKIIGYSPELFKSSILFGQKMKRIIEEEGPMKKKIFDDIFDIGYLKVAKDNCEESLRENILEYGKLEVEDKNLTELVSQVRGEYNSNRDTLRNFDKNKQERLLRLENKKKDVKSQMNEYLEEINKVVKKGHANKFKRLGKKLKFLEDTQKKLNEVSNKHFKLDMQVINLEGDIANEETIQKKLKEDFSKALKKCPQCGSRLDAKTIQSHKRHIRSGLKDSQKRVILLKEELRPVANEFKELGKYLEQYKDLPDRINRVRRNIELGQAKISQINELNGLFNVAKEKILEINREIEETKQEKIKVRLKPIKEKLQKYELKLAGIISERVRYKKKIDLYQWLIKDPLSNSGIKAFIFDSMLRLVNKELEQYSHHIGFKINFGINLDSGNKDFFIKINRKGTEINYNDISGGQQQLVNVCIAFAVHDVVCMDKACNLLALDEIFESLDEENIEIVTRLIQNKASSKSIWIITHLQSFNPVNAKVIRLGYRKGNTYLL